MPEGYFSIVRDNEIVAAGGFFCRACCVGKPAVEQSPDTRYCQGCYDFLMAEAKMLEETGRKAGSWKPKKTAIDLLPDDIKPIPIEVGVVSKLPLGKDIPLPVLKHPGGRPRKEGELSKTTAWRRNKAGQGVLI